MAKTGIAAQVYSVRDMAQEDFRGTMKALKESGYQGVELAGLYGHTPEEIRDCLKEEGLVPVSAHVPYGELLADMEGTVRAYRTIGCSYIGIPWLSVNQHCGGEQFEETCGFLKKLCACCAEQGMVLLYHNHDFEFRKTPEGDFLLDALFSAVEEIQTELDTCWAKVAGVSPVQYLNKYAGRCPVVHVKDFRREEEKVSLVALGQGELDTAAVARAAVESGAAWLVVEQDDHPYGKPMENMKESFRYLSGVAVEFQG